MCCLISHQVLISNEKTLVKISLINTDKAAFSTPTCLSVSDLSVSAPLTQTQAFSFNMHMYPVIIKPLTLNFARHTHETAAHFCFGPEQGHVLYSGSWCTQPAGVCQVSVDGSLSGRCWETVCVSLSSSCLPATLAKLQKQIW